MHLPSRATRVATRVPTRRRITAALTAYALVLQGVITAGITTPLAAQTPPPVPLSRTAAATATTPYAVVLSAVSTEFDAISGIAAYAPTNELAIAAGATGHDFELIAADGKHRAFSAAEGLARGARIATSRGEAGTIKAGSLFAPAANKIVRVSADGATVQAAWATLPSTETINAITVDRGGAFGGDVIAVTESGGVWRINASGAAVRIATTGVALGSVTTLADDAGRHGPWSARILAGAAQQPMLYAIAADGQITSHQTSVVARDLAVVTAHENFFGVDPADHKVWGARSGAFAAMVGDVVLAQSSPGVLLRVHWNGTAFESSELARVAQWQQIVFASAGVSEIPTARRPYDAIAVVRHAPVMNSGRVEGALWQLAPESVTLDGTDVITSDLLVPGAPHVVVSGSPSFGGTVEGNGAATPSTHTISLGGSSTLGHLLTRTDAMTIPPVAAFTPTTATRDVALTNENDTPGDFTTLRDLSIAGNAGAVSIPPGTYGKFSAAGRTAFILGVTGSTTASQYQLDSLTMTGGSELRLAGPVTLTLNNGATFTGSTIGAAETPRQLVMRIAGGVLRVGGNGVLYAIVRAPQSSVIVEGGARLRGTVSCDRVDISGVIQLTETDIPPPPVNRPPAVDAGADTTVTLPDVVALNGNATDDGLPAGSTLAYQWSRVSGPAEVTFGDQQKAVASAAFTVPGTYVLRLTANDGQLASSDEVTVTVKPRNVAPVVNAGADLNIELPATASLHGDVQDDGLPQGTVASKWTKVGGAGNVTFADERAPITTATFSVAGTYVLRLTADDGELTASDDVEVHVAPENLAPVVSAGDDVFAVVTQPATLNGRATDDGLPAGSTLTTKWTRASGPAAVTFADDTKPITTATFGTAGIYVVRLTATDGRFTISDDVTVTVDPANAAPTVNAGADQVIALPAVATLAGDAKDDGYPRGSQLTYTWSGSASFADSHALSTTATFAAAGTYTLTLTATDGVLTTTDELVITVDPANAAPTVNAGADQIIALPAIATLTGDAKDDGYPRGSQLTYTWSGPATFADSHALSTTASFASAGTYTLTLTATDGVLTTTDDITIIVDPANAAPTVNAGADQIIALPAVATLTGDAKDDGYPRGSQLTYMWSGPATFADLHALSTTASFASAGTYTLTLTATDGVLTTTDEVVITVDPANAAPTVNAGADQIIALPAVATLTGDAKDDGYPRGSQLTYTWSGPATFPDLHELSTTATFASAGTYTLTLTATDGVLTTTDEVTIIVDPANAAPTVNAGADQIIALPAIATLAGDAKDDGYPRGSQLTYTWSGPASFASAGTYTLTLTATDGVLTSTDEVVITVDPANAAPTVNAGADQIIALPAVATLTGDAKDDGYPRGSQLTYTWSGPATFADSHALSTTASFASAGTYTLTLTATDGVLTATDDVIITVDPANAAPTVNAGADQIIALPAIATLTGDAKDDGYPRGSQLTYTWSGPATFADSHALSTTASFASAGTYTLTLTATDGVLTTTDDVTIIVDPANAAPTVNAGADQIIALPAIATLTGDAKDDGYPRGSQLTYMWSGPATFADSHALSTTASFASAGTYTLTLTATDGVLTTTDDVVITVDPANAAPTANAGADQIIALPAIAALTGDAKDDGYPRGSQLTYTWSGPATFADSHALSTTATFTAAGTYTLTLTATDGVLTSTDDITITVDPQNAAPTVNAGADQVLDLPATAALVGDVKDDGYPRDSQLVVTWSNVSGPVAANFADEHASSTTAMFPIAGTYTLRLTATDGALTTTDDVIIEVRDPNVAPTVDAGPDQTIRLPKTIVVAANVTDDAKPQGSSVTVTWTATGPASVNFAAPHAKTTTATFTVPGVYTLRITADDTKLQSFDELTVTVLAANVAPIVSAGANQTIVLPNTATLVADAKDDGVIAPLTYSWTRVGGPAEVTFTPPNALATTAKFTVAGTYVLRFSANDGELVSTADVAITVQPANVKPSVDLGADRTVNVDDVVTLAANVTDDGLPSNTLTYKWTVISGGSPTIADDTAASTTAIFKSAGIYTLRLTASDGELSASDDITIAAVRPPVADFTVPAISRNVARWYNNLASLSSGASIISETSNDGSGIGTNVLDDSPYTRWRSGNGQNQNQSLTIRLGRDGTRSFDRIRVLNDQSATEAVKNFRLQVSSTTTDDAAFTTVLTSYLNAARNIQEIVLDAPVTAKYVRFVFLDNYGAANMAIADIEVIGAGLGGFDRLGALNVADSAQSADIAAASAWVRNPTGALDSNLASWWHASDSKNGFMTVRLTQQSRVDRVRLRSSANDGARPRDFKVEVANDLAGPYTTALTATFANQDDWQDFTFPAGAVRGRFVRLTLLNNYGYTGGCIVNDFQVLSADQPSVSSMLSPYERPELMFDNNAGSYWTATTGANEYFVVHLNDNEPRLIEAVEFQGYYSSPTESIKDFDVLVSDTTDDDAAFRPVVSGTVDGYSTQMQRFNFPGGATRARYVKVVAKNSVGGGRIHVPTFHLLTIENGGNQISVPTTAPKVVNLSPALAANGATVVASTGSGVESMLDYYIGEGWISNGLTNQFATIALAGGVTRSVSGVRVAPSYNGNGAVQNFEVWVSSTTTDPAAFTKVLSATLTTETKVQNFMFSGGAVPVRYIKYVPLTRYGTSGYFHTGLFDVILPQHPGGAVNASSYSGYYVPEGPFSVGNANPWVSATNSNEWITVALPGSQTRAVYGVTIEPWAFTPRDFDILVSNTTADDSAFTLAYSGFYSSSQRIYRFNHFQDAKYVRFLFHSTLQNTPFYINKLDVLTVPDDGASAVASSGANYDANLNSAIDIDPNGGWGSDGANPKTEQYFTVAMPGTKLWRVDHVALQQYTTCCSNLGPRDFEVQVTTGDMSDASWTTVYRGSLRPDFTFEHVFFPSASARAVRLLIHNNWGGNNIGIQNFLVFSPQIGPRTARFIDTSVPGARTIVAWAWTFGDGGTSSDRDPVHVFPGAGTYEVALSVTDADGLTTRRSMQYTVYGDLSVDFTVAPAVPLEQTQAALTDISTSPNGVIAQSDWTFGDGSSPAYAEKVIGHTYFDSGTYTVTHTAKDMRGITATKTKALVVANVPPTVNAGTDRTVQWGEPWGIAASANDVVADVKTLTCHWDFGDGSTADVTDCSRNASVVHRYMSIGTFTATLTATDKDGGSASDTVVTTTTRRPTMVSYAGSRGVAADGSIALAGVLRDGLSHDPIAGSLTFDVSGQTVTAIADATGRASASLIYTGTITPPVVTVRFDGDAKYNASSGTATLTCPPSQQALDVAQVIDLSGSMEPAIADAKNAFVEMIDSLIPGRDQTSTIIFADGADIRQPLTGNLELARKAVDTFAIFGGTNIASGIYAAMSELTSARRNPSAQPILILFSDGGDNLGSVTSAANAAKAAGIRIISVAWKNSTDFHYDVMFAAASAPNDYYEITAASQLETLFASLPGTMCIAANAAPVVSAGSSEPTIALPTTTFTLKGSAHDDGKPAGSTLTYKWTKVSGPGAVTFGTDTALETTVTITVPGTYVMRLTASDGELTSSSDIRCILKPENQAPTADAGPDLTTTMEVELLKNTGAEEPLVNGKLPSWTEAAGTWTATNSGTEPFRGARMFVSSGPTAAEMWQDVNVTGYGGTIDAGTQKLEWSVFVRVAEEAAPDAAKIIIEYRDSNNATVIKTVTTNDLTPSHLWDRVSSIDTVPQGTRNIRIRLIAARHSGTTTDVWFDAASMRLLDAGMAHLVGKWTDDLEPANTLHAAWTQVDGAPAALFNYWRAEDGWVVVPGPGVYTFRLTIDDSAKYAVDDMKLTAVAGNAAPQVNAGTDATVQLPADGTLSATSVDETSPLAWTWFFLSGPAGVSIAQPHAQSTAVTFPAAGTYVFRAYGDDGERVGVDEVTITVTPPAGNQPPVVNAGADQIVTDPPRTATLSGSAKDDGLPDGASLTYLWTTFSGPAQAVFASPNSAITGVTFPTIGTYVLRLSCSDTNKIGTDDVTVTVVTNHAPTVNAGEDVVFTDSQPLPHLNGNATDNDIPPGSALTYSWTRISGPGNATIVSPTQLNSAITLTAHGKHVFRLTATDGQLSASDDVAITWDGANTPPTVNAGADLTITLPATVSLDALVNDDGLPVGGSLSMGWSRVSGPSDDVQFANPGTAATTAKFTVPGDYMLRITVTDGEATASDDIAVTVKEAVPAADADITSPDSGATVTDRITIRGTVTNAVSWKLEYRLGANDTTAAANAWTPIASGTGNVTDAALGTLDPTLLLNGVYKIRLLATNSAGESDVSSVAVLVDGDLKIGLFTVTFTDVNIPLTGLSLAVNRVYDSRDKRIGDFGYGWTMRIRNVRLDKSGVPGTNWQQTRSAGAFPTYCVTPTIPRIVSVTFPNNQVYKFRAAASPQCQVLAPLQSVTMVFEPIGNTHAKLVPADGGDVIVAGAVPGPVELITADTVAYNPTSFVMTTEEGTAFNVDEVAGLQKITDRNANYVTVTRDAIIHSSGRRIDFARDAAGRITTITDSAGETHTYSYDANGDLKSVTDPTNRTTTFTYDAAHRLLEYFDAAGRRGVRNDYDLNGRLISMTDSDGHVTTMTFDPALRRETTIDRAGHPLITTYDENGRVVSMSAGTKETRATYDSLGNMISWTDWLGRTSTFTYDGNGNLLTETDSAGHVTTHTYNSFGQETSTTDPKGHTVTYMFDDHGNLLSTKDPVGAETKYVYDGAGRRTTETYADGTTRSFHYNAAGHVSEEIDENGGTTSYTYDAAGRRTSVTTPEGGTATYSYDAAGRHTSTTTARGTTSVEFDEAGQVDAMVDEQGHRTVLAGNTAGQPVSAHLPDDSDWSMQYDANGLAAGATRSGLAPTHYIRDAAGAITGFTRGGYSESYEADAEGRRSAMTDAEGRTTRFGYDVHDRLASVTDPLGHVLTTTYDAAGNRETVKDQRGNETRFVYDANNRLTAVQQADGRSTAYGWNEVGELVSAQAPNGSIRQYSYDSAGHLATATETGGGVSAYAWNGDGNLETAQDPLLNLMHLDYDTASRLTKRTFADGSSEQVTYEGALPKKVTDRGGHSGTFVFDSMNRVAGAQWSDGSTATQTYTPAGQLDVLHDGGGDVDYDYDNLGNVVRITNSDGTFVAYEYDALNNRTATITPAGKTAYRYDAMKRIVAVTSPGGSETTYEYDDAGNLTQTHYPNGWSTNKTYDAMNRVSSVITRKQSGEAIFSETYERNAHGDASRITMQDGSAVDYDYDDVSRLVRETYRDGAGDVSRVITYGYDAAGNRTTLVDSAASEALTYTYAAAGELLSDGVNTYGHDGDGNLTSVSGPSVASSLQYDIHNRLVSVSHAGNTVMSIHYRPDGSRARIEEGGAATRFVVDGASRFPHVLMESGSDGASYVYGNGLVSVTRGGKDYFYIQDGGGSVRALVDADGNVTDTYQYTAFGLVRERTGTTPNRFLYRGEQFDPQTGFYFLRARYYDPATGRFLTMDSYDGVLEAPQTRNRYTYAVNNPIAKVDPCGHCPMPYEVDVGNLVDDAIGLWYASYMLPCMVHIDEYLPRNHDWKVGRGYGKKRGGLGCRPDLFEDCTGEVFEVKHLSITGVAIAFKEAVDYSLALNVTIGIWAGVGGNGVWYHPGSFTFKDPPAVEVLDLEVHGPHFHMITGAVFWSENWNKDRDKLRETQKERVPETVAATEVSYGYENSTLKVQNLLGAAVVLGMAAAIGYSAWVAGEVAANAPRWARTGGF
ncbi:MAG TPA: PKD domain-containing protein [Thermoanaerobaculia bacterium]|nr:PKD domain-containing protein [Thermoanaerobaculia bacterium]